MLYGLHNVLLQGHSQMQAVQQEMDSVKAEIQATKQELAAAEQADDGAKVDFLRNSLVEMHKKEVEMRKEMNSLHEQQTILLRAQAPGQHCLPCQNWLKPHTPVCAHHVRANFPHCAVPSP